MSVLSNKKKSMPFEHKASSEFGSVSGKAHKEKNKQSKKVTLSREQGVNFAPQAFISQNLKLIPPEHVTSIEYLLYTKPNLSLKTHSNSSMAVDKVVIGRKSILSSFSKDRKGRQGLWNNLSKMMGLDASNVLFKQTKDTCIGSAPSLFKIRTDPWPEHKIKDGTFSVTISESKTFNLFYCSSTAAKVGTERAEAIKEINEDYWTRLRTYKKMYNVETQTPSPLYCDRWVGMKMNVRRNTQSQVFVSDIYDTYKQLNNSDSILETQERQNFKKEPIVFNSQDDKANKEENRDEDEFYEASRMVEVVESVEFHQSALNLLRNIDKNVNWKKQIIFHKGNATDPMSKTCKITYDIDHLWTLRYLNVWGMPVTSLCINHTNPNIIAVGHGMYFMDQPQYLGRVCIWNLKNCTLPEKTFEFKDGVTSVSFSRLSPFALLVSLISGSVNILDISKPKPQIIGSCNVASSNAPIWQVKWFKFDSGVEEPVACGVNGQVYLISKNDFVGKVFLSLGKREGTVKGVPLPKMCRKPLSVSERPSVTCLATNPENCFSYLVGTDDGCVHICSTDYWHQHTDVFQAHIGPVHHIKYHPDTSKIFLTVGIDYFVRIWAFGLFEVLFYVRDSDYPIEDADWCPNNPNILVTVASDRIAVWDLSRVKLVPQRYIHSPTGSRFTSVKFTSNGCSLICGDISGDIHVYTLSNMPLLFIDKGWALCGTIKRLVLGKKDLYEQLKTMGYPFDIDTSDSLAY